MTHFAIALMWLLHWLPLPVLAWVGRGFGQALYWLAAERRRVAMKNLELCFPELTPQQRTALTQEHFALFGRSFIELGLWWWASPARIRRLVRLEGAERIAEYHGKPVIVLVPHFVALDAGAIRFMLEHDIVAIYAHQKNRIFEASLNGGRRRFGNCELFVRQEGLRKAIRRLKQGCFFFYPADMDFGAKDSVFVPFFGVPTATVTALSRMAKLTGAVVIPIVTRMEKNGYVATLGEPWANFPTDSDEADARRMNAFIEMEARKSPAQYYWVHKRFKTRPEGEERFY